MARQPDIQYVRFYTTGSAARKIELLPQPKEKTAPARPKQRRKVRRREQVVLRIDPISLCAMLVAGILLVAMIVGMIELGSIDAQADQMETYVSELRAENAQLQAEYEAGYDLDDIREKALAMGLVSIDQVEHITIHVEHPQPEPERSAWDTFWADFWDMFA
ncbi:MAG: hypothetical protein IJW45_01275 [Oscillospiraceae bacterium]|nr:hypothetical protein [Oscillospiraceae bacterium]